MGSIWTQAKTTDKAQHGLDSKDVGMENKRSILSLGGVEGQCRRGGIQWLVVGCSHPRPFCCCSDSGCKAELFSKRVGGYESVRWGYSTTRTVVPESCATDATEMID